MASFNRFQTNQHKYDKYGAKNFLSRATPAQVREYLFEVIACFGDDVWGTKLDEQSAAVFGLWKKVAEAALFAWSEDTPASVVVDHVLDLEHSYGAQVIDNGVGGRIGYPVSDKHFKELLDFKAAVPTLTDSIEEIKSLVSPATYENLVSKIRGAHRVVEAVNRRKKI